MTEYGGAIMTDRRNSTDAQRSLQNALNSAEAEKQLLSALCINYTAAYVCDLRRDRMQTVKQKSFSHAALAREKMHDQSCYSEWIRCSYDTFIVKATAPDYLEVFDPQNLMRRLQSEESFVYRHKTLPNTAGMQYFEATVVRLYMDESSFKIIIGYRPIDDLIAEQTKLREELEKALIVANRASQAKTEFLRRMSHDIRTPLNGLIGLININEAHLDNTELVRANHEKMRVSANHLLSLINDVLQMSKLEDGTVVLAHERISLMDLTRDIVNIVVDRAVEHGLRWNYEKGKAVIPYPYIYGSPLHLRQIFLNIYGNCIKYNRPGGSVTTIVEALDERDGKCTYRWTISDTGIGMSEEFVKHIFEPFSQEHSDARSDYHGTGLGMAIVKSLLDQMGGSIAVASELDVGTTFVIEIPFEIAPAPETQPVSPPVEAESVRGLRLLLAEDNALSAEIAQTLLTDEGAEVTVVSDGQQAVDRFRESPVGTFDAILMDIMMPVMDGLTATREIRASNRADAKTVPIIAMTANAFHEDAQQCFDAGMNVHLAKPLQIRQVVSEIAKCCMKNK